jgi:hypothetical protein
MSKNNVMNIGKKLEPKKNCTNHCNENLIGFMYITQPT